MADLVILKADRWECGTEYACLKHVGRGSENGTWLPPSWKAPQRMIWRRWSLIESNGRNRMVFALPNPFLYPFGCAHSNITIIVTFWHVHLHVHSDVRPNRPINKRYSNIRPSVPTPSDESRGCDGRIWKACCCWSRPEVKHQTEHDWRPPTY